MLTCIKHTPKTNFELAQLYKNHKHILAGQNYVTLHAQGGSSIFERGEGGLSKNLYSVQEPQKGLPEKLPKSVYKKISAQSC